VHPEKFRNFKYAIRGYICQMLQSIRLTIPFLIVQVVFTAAALVMIGAYPHHELHLKLTNALGHSMLDPVFAYLTFLGDGAVLAIPCVIILVFISARVGFQFLLAYLISGLCAQLLKLYVFADQFRPAAEISTHPDFRAIEGISHNISNSFPSGHATSAFACCYSLALVSKSRKTQAILGIAAVLIALSRVYLSQHYLRDIVAGGLIGTGCALVVWILIQRIAFLNNPKPLLAWKR
jgi:membrane-associated phospholipid phosphatase